MHRYQYHRDRYTKQLRQFAAQKDWSQRDIAEITHTSQPTVSRWLAGQSIPDIVEWELIKEAANKAQANTPDGMPGA